MGVVLISCIDFYVIHLLVQVGPEQESIQPKAHPPPAFLLEANLVLMMHEEIFKH